jgi:hypothetical protein
MDGTVLPRARRRPQARDIPVILMSAGGQVGERFVMLGIVDYIASRSPQGRRRGLAHGRQVRAAGRSGRSAVPGDRRGSSCDRRCRSDAGPRTASCGLDRALARGRWSCRRDRGSDRDDTAAIAAAQAALMTRVTRVLAAVDLGLLGGRSRPARRPARGPARGSSICRRPKSGVLTVRRSGAPFGIFRPAGRPAIATGVPDEFLLGGSCSTAG